MAIPDRRVVLWMVALLVAAVAAVLSCGDFVAPPDAIIVEPESRECPPGWEKQGRCTPPPTLVATGIGWLDPDSLDAWVDAQVRIPAVGYGEPVRFCAYEAYSDGSVGVGNTQECLDAYEALLQSQAVSANLFLTMFDFSATEPTSPDV